MVCGTVLIIMSDQRWTVSSCIWYIVRHWWTVSSCIRLEVDSIQYIVVQDSIQSIVIQDSIQYIVRVWWTVFSRIQYIVKPWLWLPDDANVLSDQMFHSVNTTPDPPDKCFPFSILHLLLVFQFPLYFAVSFLYLANHS